MLFMFYLMKSYNVCITMPDWCEVEIRLMGLFA